LIWLKVVSLDISWLVGLTDDLKKFLKCCFIFFIYILKSLVVLAKFMPIANVHRIGYVNKQSVSQFALSVSQFELSASLLRFGIYSFIIHINLADFYWGGTSLIGIG